MSNFPTRITRSNFPTRSVIRVTSAVVSAVMLVLSLFAGQAHAAKPTPADTSAKASTVYVLKNDRLCMSGINCRTFRYDRKSNKKAPMAFASTNDSCISRDRGDQPVLHDNIRRGQSALLKAQAWNPPVGNDEDETYPVRWETLCFPVIKGWVVRVRYYNEHGKYTGGTTYRIKKSKSGKWIGFGQLDRSETDHGAYVVLKVNKLPKAKK